LLFTGQTVSQLGDWFNSVAVYALLLDLTGSATFVAWMMIVQFLPIAVVAPMAGVVVDRVDRRRLMIAADLVRGILILGLLLVRQREDVWLAYVVMAPTVAASAFFEPARTATIPNIKTPHELMPANALSAATWSAMLAVGASVGGLMTSLAGRNVAFGINALSFFVSAAFIWRMTGVGSPGAVPRAAQGLLALTGIPDLVDGVRYVRAHRHVARGVGAALGPIALRWILGHVPRRLRRAIGPAYFIFGGFLSRAGGGAEPRSGFAVRAVRPFRPVDALGFQHRPAPARSA
jgi:MFS family permease